MEEKANTKGDKVPPPSPKKMADQPPSFGECWMRSVDELVSSWVEESACGSEGYGAHHSPLPGCGDLAGIHHVTESRQLRWQLTERTLEIVEVGSLVNGLPLKSCGLRLFLGSGVLHSSGVSFVSRGSGSAVETCLCVATANQVLVRVSFRLNDVNDPSQSMFSNGQRDIFQAKFCEEKGWNPECVCRVDYDTVAFGCTNGALMIGNFWEAADVVGDEVGSQVIFFFFLPLNYPPLNPFTTPPNIPNSNPPPPLLFFSSPPSSFLPHLYTGNLLHRIIYERFVHVKTHLEYHDTRLWQHSFLCDRYLLPCLHGFDLHSWGQLYSSSLGPPFQNLCFCL